MQNKQRTLHYAFAAMAFVVSLVTYYLTVQPTVPFWDCGEFTAAAVQQQVPHPPGAPLFLMLGKIFHLIPIGDDGWRVNMVSVVASALTVLLLYLITEKVIRHFFLESLDEGGNGILVYGSSLVAALAYTFSDTFWFNAVESEVYAASALFVALIVWIMMVWSDKADEPGHEKYLLLIAYLIGLSTGVHLLSLLTIFSLVLLVYLRKYQVKPMGLVLTAGAGVAAFVVIYYFIIMRLPAIFAGTLPFFKSEAREYPIVDNQLIVVLGLLMLAGIAYLAWWGRKHNRPMISLASTSVILMVLGYSTYGHIMVRANSNPPMNENKPDSFSKLVSYLGREQYGEAPNWPRRYQMDQRFRKAYDEAGPFNGIKTKVVQRKDGSYMRIPDYANTKVNTGAELKYLWNYQLDHMYLRYFLWNFAGRTSDQQDAPAYVAPFTSKATVAYWTHKDGYPGKWPTNFWSIPLILGMIGIYVHFKRDPRMASVYLLLFLMTGVLAALQQNQQNPQPRERDYFYIASFMVYAMWIGIGVFGIAERLKANMAATGGAIAAALLVVPVNMAWQGWYVHNRTGNYMAFDYAYNILQSADKDAIIFTNGDNDTFPVWYIQDVAGVRQDVRLVNLSLGQTTWYIEQLKNRSPHGAKKVPLSFSDESLNVPEDDPRALSYDLGYEELVEFPVDPAIIAQYTNDSALIKSGTFRFTFKGSPRDRDEKGRTSYFIGVQHKLVKDIITQTRFTRPVYFSTSVGDPSWADEFSGLGDYLRLEGMCLRVCPAPQRSAIGENVDAKAMEAALMHSLDGPEYFKEPHRGLKLRNLGNEDVYYDDVHRGYVLNYRNVFYKYATYLLYDKSDTTHAAQVLRRMNEKLSLDKFPMGVGFELQMAKLAKVCKDKQQTKALAERSLASAKALIENPALRKNEPQWDERSTPERFAAESALLLGRFDEAKAFYKMLASGVGSDPVLNYLIDEIDIEKLEYKGDVKGALAAAELLQSKYVMTQDQASQQAASMLMQKISSLRQQLGLAQGPMMIPVQ